jgi:hypothetical protein
MALILSLSAVPRRCPQWIQAVSRGQSRAGRIGRDSIRRLGKRFERSPPGACPGHGLADNHRHERSVPDTRDALFTWENTRCQPLPSDWFFLTQKMSYELPCQQRRRGRTVDTAVGQEEWEVELRKLR